MYNIQLAYSSLELKLKRKTERVKHFYIVFMSGSSHIQISKLLSNFGCLFTFCYLDGANSIKTDYMFVACELASL